MKYYYIFYFPAYGHYDYIAMNNLRRAPGIRAICRSESNAMFYCLLFNFSKELRRQNKL